MDSMLYLREYPVTKQITIHIPTVGEVLNQYGEDDYYNILSYFLATSYDLMLELEEVGEHYETVSDFDLFLRRFEDFQKQDTSILFPGIDFSTFGLAESPANGDIVIWDGGDIVIDNVVFWNIAQFLRKLSGTKRNWANMGNEEARRYTLEKLKRKRNRQKNRKSPDRSILEAYIIALVNTSEFKYDYESVLDLTLYQFNQSLRQVQKKVSFDYMMTGVFMGTVDLKKSGKQLNWINFDSTE